MFTKQAHQDVDLYIIIHWLLMSLCAGMMNAVAFIGLGTFATHVTGFGTLFGVHAATAQWGNAIAALAVPLFFLLGAVVSGLCVEARVRRQKQPHYDYVMYFCSLLLITAWVVANASGLDQEQSYLHLRQNFLLLSMICLSSGLINAALSYSSKASVRITHLTGVTTDLGRGIAELITLRLAGQTEIKRELRVNLIRILTIASFMSGAVVGAVLFARLHFRVLLIPALCFAYAGLHGRKIKEDYNIGN